MQKRSLLICAVFCGCMTMAQTTSVVNIARSCSEARLKKNLYYLASDALEGRMTASHGDTLASQFVAQQFAAAGLQAPYNGSYLQTVPLLQQQDKPFISFGGTDYALYDGWSLYPPGAKADVSDCPVMYTSFTTKKSLQSYLDTANLRGDVLLLQLDLFADYIRSGEADHLDSNLHDKGVTALLFASPRVGSFIAYHKKEPHLPTLKLADPSESRVTSKGILPEMSFTPQQLMLLLGADSALIRRDTNGRDSTPQPPFLLHSRVSLHSAPQFSPVQAPNVVGILPGTDPSLPCVVVSAHHDHDGHNGKTIWYGAVDNGSGTVAIIEMANLMKMAAGKGARPKRTVVFASFTGEERGLLGSFWYADHPVPSAASIFANLNIDMLGRVDTLHTGKRKDSPYVYAITRDTAGTLMNESVEKANQSLPHLLLDSFYQKDPQFFMRSDQYPFAKKGIQVVWFDCGFCTDYHEPTDTPDKIDYALLAKQTQLAFLTLWNLANR